MNKTFSLMGICRKAGSLLLGHDSTFDAVRSGKVKLIILTSDASPRHVKELEAVKYTGNRVVLDVSSDTLAPYIGKRSCIFGVTDAGFSDALEKTIHEEGISHEHNNSKV